MNQACNRIESCFKLLEEAPFDRIPEADLSHEALLRVVQPCFVGLSHNIELNQRIAEYLCDRLCDIYKLKDGPTELPVYQPDVGSRNA